MNNNQILPGIVYPAGNGYVNTTQPTITGTGIPGAVVSGKVDNKPFTAPVSENGTWSVTCDQPLADKAEHTIVLSQTDQSGAVSPQVTGRFRTDTSLLTPHTVSFPYSNQIINTNTPVLSGTGKVGALIEAKLCGKTYTTAVGSDGLWHIGTDRLPEGLVKACVSQRDQGNGCPDIQVSFTVDSVAPAEPVLEEPADNGFIKNAKPVLRGRGEPNAVVDAVVDDKKYAAKVDPQGSWSIELAQTLAEDVHIISARQKDQAGNQSPEKVTLFTVKSMQPPVPTVDKPKNGEFIRGTSPLISGRGERDCLIEVHIGERVIATHVDTDGTWSLMIPPILTEGPNTLKFYQIDKAGNVSRNVDLSLVVDTKAPPPPAVIYPERDGYIVSSDFCVRGTGEPEASIDCTLGGTTYKTRVQSDGSWQIDIRGGDTIRYAMEYSLSVKQTDLAGNQSPCTRVEFRLDPNRLTAPDMTYPKSGSSIGTVNPILTGTGKVGAVVQVNIRNETFTAPVGTDSTWSLSLQKPLCEGETIVNLCQADTGNISQTRTVRFRIDIQSPQPPTIISPSENQIIGGPLILSGSGENGAAVTVRLDDKSYTASVRNGSWVLPVPDAAPNGIHSVLASQTDEAGNKSPCTSLNFVYYSENQSPPGTAGLATYQMLYNPPGPEWAQETIVTLKTSAPLSVNNICGTVFSTVVRKNGVVTLDYIDLNGCSGKVSGAVTWIDGTPPVIVLKSSGNAFSSEKTVQYFKSCGAGIASAMLNGMPFEAGRIVTEEGVYTVEVRDQAGNTARESFIIDKTPPVIQGAVDGMIYKSDVMLKFTDSLSGIQSAVLNGKNILSCTTLTEDGDYTLKVTDHGGNAAEVNFSIRK